MSNTKTSSQKMASLAASILQDPGASVIARQLAGSVLSQVNKKKETGKEMESLAAGILSSGKYNEETRQLAASVLSQSNRER